MSKYVYEACPRCIRNGKDSRGDNLVVYHNGHSHCFACGYHTFPKYGKPQLIKEEHVPKSVRPADFTREVPTNGLQWLLQYGLPYSYWQRSLGYSKDHGERLVFTVGSPVAFSIGRLLTEPTRNSRKWYVWGDSHKHTEVIGESHQSEQLVLVEDLISAHKVGQVNTAIPLFGTQLHPCHYYYLINANKPVILWLDKDQEFNMKKQALRLESIINKPVVLLTTDKDPKELSYDAIQSRINSP